MEAAVELTKLYDAPTGGALTGGASTGGASTGGDGEVWKVAVEKWRLLRGVAIYDEFYQTLFQQFEKRFWKCLREWCIYGLCRGISLLLV